MENGVGYSLILIIAFLTSCQNDSDIKDLKRKVEQLELGVSNMERQIHELKRTAEKVEGRGYGDGLDTVQRKLSSIEIEVDQLRKKERGREFTNQFYGSAEDRIRKLEQSRK